MSNSNPNVSLREKALYWEQLLAGGLEHERWGQPEEALQQFVKARREMEQFLSNEADTSPRSKTFLLSSSTKMTLQKVTLCVQDRIRRLRDPISNKETSVRPGPCGAIPDDAIECLNGKLADILVHGGEPFPVDVPLPTPLQKTRSGYQTNTRWLQKDEDNTLEQLEDIREDRGGEFKHVGVSGRGDLDSSESLQKSKKKSVLTKAGSVRVLDTMRSLSFLQKRENLPRGHHEEQLATDTPDTLLSCPEVSEGETVVKLELEKIGLKDPSAFVDPFLTITLCDAEGTKMGPAQNTKIAMKTEEDHVVFEGVCYIQKPLEQISPGSNVFIEFRHWKTKESKVSNRCWSMMSLQELKKPGAAFLEIYAKPTDFKARKFTRHSVKPLFMHVHVVHLRE